MNRRGMLLLEMAVSVVLLLALTTLCLRYFAVTASQRRELDQRQTALCEASNIIERLSARPYGDLTPEIVSKISLSPEILLALPEVELKIDIADEIVVQPSRLPEKDAQPSRLPENAGETPAPQQKGDGFGKTGGKAHYGYDPLAKSEWTMGAARAAYGLEAPTMNRRSGFSLIEMLVVITVGATLSGIAVLMVYALLKNHNTGRESLEYSRTVNRLAERFRSDIHAMQQTSPTGDETVVELLNVPANDTKIRYQCLERRIDRSELQGDKIMSQDSFMLPPGMSATIKTRPQQDVTIACIAISPKNDITPKLYRPAPIRIEAVLGRDSRLSKAQSPTEGQP